MNGSMSAAQHRYGAPSHDYGVSGSNMAEYKPNIGGHSLTSYQAGYRTSVEHAGGSFTTSMVSQGRVLGRSAQTAGGVFKWDGGGETPSFKS